MEIFKDVKGYEGLYQISNYGNCKSLKRYVSHHRGGKRLIKERILKKYKNKEGYELLCLTKNGTQKTRTVHQLVAESFLNHKPNRHKLVVNHIDFNRNNNHLSNLEVITQRENTNRKHCKSSSKYVGVSWHKQHEKWSSRITINSNTVNLGSFSTEIEASEVYQNKLKTL